MEHDFSVCSEKVVPFSRWKFSDGTACSIFAKVYQFQAAHDHIFGKEIWRLLLQLPRWLPSPPLSTNAQSMMAWLLISELRNSSCGLYFSAQSLKGPSSHPEVAFKFIDRKLTCKQNIFIKTFISGKMAPHIGYTAARKGMPSASELKRTSSSKEKSSIRSTITVVPPFCILAGNKSDGEGSLG